MVEEEGFRIGWENQMAMKKKRRRRRKEMKKRKWIWWKEGWEG